MTNFKLNPSKNKMFYFEMKYLGYIISTEGIRTDAEKIIALEDCARPVNAQQSVPATEGF